MYSTPLNSPLNSTQSDPIQLNSIRSSFHLIVCVGRYSHKSACRVLVLHFSTVYRSCSIIFSSAVMFTYQSSPANRVSTHTLGAQFCNGILLAFINCYIRQFQFQLSSLLRDNCWMIFWLNCYYPPIFPCQIFFASARSLSVFINTVLFASPSPPLKYTVWVYKEQRSRSRIRSKIRNIITLIKGI